MNTDSVLRRVWHRWQPVPPGTHVTDGLGRPWTAMEHRGYLMFTDGPHVVLDREIEYPVTERDPS